MKSIFYAAWLQPPFCTSAAKYAWSIFLVFEAMLTNMGF